MEQAGRRRSRPREGAPGLSRGCKRFRRQTPLRHHTTDHAQSTHRRDHRATGETIGIEIPARVREAIGLDDAPSWVVVSEHNVDEWPNGGLAPLPGRPGVFGYGFIPPSLFAQIKTRFLALAEQGRGAEVRR